MPTRAHTVRMPDELWKDLGRAARLADPELDCAGVLRQFARWYVGAGPMPKLPPGEVIAGMKQRRAAGLTNGEHDEQE